jgi:ribose 5-phosphate isomerase A
MSALEQKEAVARLAAQLVEDGMHIGLGSGSTAELLVHALGNRYRDGLRIEAVATSDATEAIAREYGIPLHRLDESHRLDLYIDGADEVDPCLELIKGHGGALLREKMVATASDRFVVIVDESKLVAHLGERFPVPIEVVQFGWLATKHRLQDLGLEPVLRLDTRGEPYVTSNANVILDCTPRRELDLGSRNVAEQIKLQTGVVEHGLFLGMAALALVGRDDGTVDQIEPPRR